MKRPVWQEEDVMGFVDENRREGQVLSIIVVVVSDTVDRQIDLSMLTDCLNALQSQRNPPVLEIIVPYPNQITDFEVLGAQYPGVRFIPVNDLKHYSLDKSSREHHDELRARGIAAAGGDIIALLEDHALPDPGWCQQIVEAHRKNFAGIGGAIENGIPRALNWAVYYCDFGKYQNPVPVGETAFASDANVAYKRAPLFAIRSTWEQAFHETEVNWTLRMRGEKLALDPRIIVYQNRKNLQLVSALKERYVWGRSYAFSRRSLINTSRRLFYLLSSPLLPAILVLRLTVTALRKRSGGMALLQALPVIILLTLCWSLGEMSGYAINPPKPITVQLNVSTSPTETK